MATIDIHHPHSLGFEPSRRAVDDKLIVAVSRADYSIGIMTDGDTRLRPAVKVLLPARSILEKSGLFINSAGRLQYSSGVMDPPQGTYSHWMLLNELAGKCGGRITDAESDRDLTLWYMESERRLSGLSIREIKETGVDLMEMTSGARN